MGSFEVVRDQASRSLEKAGRFRVEGDEVVIYLDRAGSFQIRRCGILPVVLGLGDGEILDRQGARAGTITLSGSGRGLKMGIRDELYLVPVQRMKRVLEGKEKKGAVFRAPEQGPQYPRSLSHTIEPAGT
jgi:hypothetical protein